MSALQIFLFGPPRVEKDNQPIEIKRRKTLALFTYLVVTRQPHSRDALATLFWPDNDQSSARANLRRDISRLKKALGETSLILDGDTVNWNPGFELWLDVKDFQFRLDRTASHDHSAGSPCPDCSATLTEAVNLYTDDFLAGFSLPDSPEFDDWQFFQAESLRRLLSDALQTLIDWRTHNGDYTQAIAYARRWLALDSLHEPAHQTLMRLYAWAGERASALRQYDECARLLREKLKLQPDEETRRLYEAIKTRQLQPPEKSAVEEPAHVAPMLQGIPQDVSPFIGREAEISDLVAMMAREEARLVTIVALGGTGKTRLSVEVAKRLVHEQPALIPDGGTFVSLACVDRPNSLPYAIAKDLGLPLGGQIKPIAELVNLLREKRMLLILDNFEQLVEGAPMLQDLLNACPGLKLLVTSREPLRLSFEWRFDLDGLPYPEAETTDADRLESVRLFLQSAEKVKTGFELNDETRPLVYRLCARLAGMPLAIKLAANWLRVMSPEQIVTEVERSLDILTGQMRDIPDRQRSMNAVFESTWSMLSSEEQRAFASLAVFRGRFSMHAAQQVAEVSPYLLAGLVDHGLVRLRDGSRYEVHELMRQFAASKLKGNEEINTLVHSRHSAYYLDLVVQSGRALYGQTPQKALQVLKNDLSNIRFAWDWAVENLSLTELNPVFEPLTAFYEIAGYLVIGEQAFWAALQRHGDTGEEPEERIALFTLLMHYTLFLVFEGRWMEAEKHIDRIETLAKSLDDDASLADAYQIKGLVYHHGEKKAEAVELFGKAIEIYHALNNPRRLIYSLNHMGEGLSYLLKPQDALRCHEEALHISRRIGERRMEALSLSHMGVSYYYINEFDKAIHHWEQAASIFEQVGDVRDNGRTRNNLSYIYSRLGEYEKAVRYGEEALALISQIGDRLNEANTSDTLGEAYFALGLYQKARQHFEKAIQISQEIQHEGSDPASYHTNLARLEIAMGQYAEAEQKLEQACSFREGEGHPKEIARYLSILARLYERTGRRDQALDSIEQGIALLQDADDQLEKSELLVQKASLLLDNGKTEQAESSLDEALQVMQAQSIPPVLFEAQLLSARVLHAKGQTEKARQRLEVLHRNSKTDAQHAAIHYALWQIHAEAQYAQPARTLYDRLAKQTPNVEYRERLLELQKFREKEKCAPV